MNRRIIRNGLFSLALAAIAAGMLPAQKASAQTNDCEYHSTQYALCVSAGGGEWCEQYYWMYVVPACT